MYISGRHAKYPPNAIFRNAIINAQRANVTGPMIWHTNPRPAHVEHAFARNNCKRSEHSYEVIGNSVYNIIESVDSISRDERDAPLTQYIIQTLEYLALGTLLRILKTTIVFNG